jgi:hypothetical protein
VGFLLSLEAESRLAQETKLSQGVAFHGSVSSSDNRSRSGFILWVAPRQVIAKIKVDG